MSEFFLSKSQYMSMRARNRAQALFSVNYSVLCGKTAAVLIATGILSVRI